MNSIQTTVEIVNELGLHARAAAVFVKEANKFSADIMVGKDGFEVNGKSIMGLMMLAAQKGSSILLKIDGTDANEASEALISLIANRFGEAK